MNELMRGDPVCMMVTPIRKCKNITDYYAWKAGGLSLHKLMHSTPIPAFPLQEGRSYSEGSKTAPSWMVAYCTRNIVTNLILIRFINKYLS